MLITHVKHEQKQGKIIGQLNKLGEQVYFAQGPNLTPPVRSPAIRPSSRKGRDGQGQGQDEAHLGCSGRRRPRERGRDLEFLTNGGAGTLDFLVAMIGSAPRGQLIKMRLDFLKMRDFTKFYFCQPVDSWGLDFFAQSLKKF